MTSPLITLDFRDSLLIVMGQEFQVVRCYSCQVFQVQQVKKDPRWVCKVCNEKQSLKLSYYR